VLKWNSIHPNKKKAIIYLLIGFGAGAVIGVIIGFQMAMDKFISIASHFINVDDTLIRQYVDKYYLINNG